MTRLAGIAVLALGVIAAGLSVQPFRQQPWADPAGTVLYAWLVYLLVTAVAPWSRPLLVAAVTAAVCTAVELVQLTGFPAVAADVFAPAALVLGTGFAWPDLAAYLAGSAAAGALHAVVRRARGPHVEQRAGTSG